jgi:hypothetical protein
MSDWTWSSQWPAPAKLNLFLHVVGRRTDGYHLLQTLFRFVGHGDMLHFIWGVAKLVKAPDFRFRYSRLALPDFSCIIRASFKSLAFGRPLGSRQVRRFESFFPSQIQRAGQKPARFVLSCSTSQ